MRTAFAATIAVVCLFPAIASAEESVDSGVGRRRIYFGEIVGASQNGFESSVFTYQHHEQTFGDARGDNDYFRVAPSADVRVFGGLTIGGTLGTVIQHYASASTGSDAHDVELDTWSAFLIPRVGFLIPIGKRVAVWPRVGAGPVAYTTSNKLSPTLTSTETSLGVVVTADSTIVLGITKELFFSLGPTVSWSSLSSPLEHSSTVSVGARGGLGLAF